MSELEGLLKVQEENSKQEQLQQREQHTEVVCLPHGSVACGRTFRFLNTTCLPLPYLQSIDKLRLELESAKTQHAKVI